MCIVYICCNLNVVGEYGWVYALKDFAQVMNNSKQSCIVTPQTEQVISVVRPRAHIW